MENVIEKLRECIERGKVSLDSSYPPDMEGKKGADEYTKEALNNGVDAETILNEALFKGMNSVGIRFRDNEIFVPEVLMAAKAMSVAMKNLSSVFSQGSIVEKGTFIIGTAAGDMHDIGKSLVAMIIEGGGWNVIDLGTNVPTEKFLAAIEENPGCTIGISALLTTTMVNMEKTVKDIKHRHPDVNILIGGAPVSQSFCESIGADFYSSEPHGALDYLNQRN